MRPNPGWSAGSRRATPTERTELTPETLRGRFVAFLRSGVLVVEDPASEATNPDWDPARWAHDVDDGSILLRVRVAVDGPVEVEVHAVEGAQDDLTAGLVPVVETSIDTPDDTVRVRDPEERVSSVVRSEREDLRTPLRVRALVDDVEDAGRVLVLLG